MRRVEVYTEALVVLLIEAGRLSVSIHSGRAWMRKTRADEWKELVPRDNGQGYGVVNVGFRGTTIKMTMHRLVWIAANGEIPAGVEIDHLNRDVSDNRIDNLRLVTHSENLRNRNFSGPKTRLTDDQLGEVLNGTIPCSELARLWGFSPGYLTAIRRGEQLKWAGSLRDEAA
jgi:hypothetical protein